MFNLLTFDGMETACPAPGWGWWRALPDWDEGVFGLVAALPLRCSWRANFQPIRLSVHAGQWRV